MNTNIIREIISDENLCTRIVKPRNDKSKSAHVNLSLNPAVRENAKKKCASMGISLSEAVNQLLVAWTDEE